MSSIWGQGEQVHHVALSFFYGSPKRTNKTQAVERNFLESFKGQRRGRMRQEIFYWLQSLTHCKMPESATHCNYRLGFSGLSLWTVKFWWWHFNWCERSSLNYFCVYTNQVNKLSLFSWLNKQTHKTISYCFTLFMFGGPCHLSIFKQTLFSCENSLFIRLWKRKYISEFVLLPCSYCKYYNPWIRLENRLKTR